MSDEIYLGNPNLKKANVAQEFTEDNIREYIKCKNNPVYFAANYIKIVTLDEGLMPFRPYDFQEELIENFHKKNLTYLESHLQLKNLLLKHRKNFH